MTGIPMPVEISDVERVFPAGALDYMPAWDDIPEEFRNGSSEWCHLVTTWLHRGLSKRFGYQVTEGLGLDGNMVWRQLTAIAGSYAPKHEHKIAAMAYLCSVWMEGVIYGPQGAELKDMKVLGIFSMDEWLEYLSKHDPITLED